MSETPTIHRVAAALFEGFTVLDMYGPAQAFASCRVPNTEGGFDRLFEIFTIAEQTGVVRSGEGPPSVAEYSFADAPSYDIPLIPGGFGTRAAVGNPHFLDQLATASQGATTTATVCTGSALLDLSQQFRHLRRVLLMAFRYRGRDNRSQIERTPSLQRLRLLLAWYLYSV